MKHFRLLLPTLLFLIAAPAHAHHGGGSCQAQSEHIDAHERAAYLRACLTSASSRAKTHEATSKEKQMRCAQNAKNLQLQGNEKDSYIKTCLSRNEAMEKKEALNTRSALASTTVMDSASR